MIEIQKSFLDESGRHILVLSAPPTHIKDIFLNVCSLQKETIADEYHLNVKGKHMVFGPHVTFRELMELFYNLNETIPLTRRQLSKEERTVLEYNVSSFDKSHWTPSQKRESLYSLLDIALLFYQVEWAKKLYTTIQNIEKSSTFPPRN